MAIRTFNSVGGFSVGELANLVIDSTGIGSFTSIKTDQLLRADGSVWDLQQAAGNAGWIQFNTDNNFDASANLTFVAGTAMVGETPATLATFTVGGNIVSTNISASDAISANTIGANVISVDQINAGNIDLSGDFVANGNVTIGGNVDITGDMSVGNIVGNLTGNVFGNFSGNVSGNFSGNITGGASIAAPGSDTNVIFNDGSKIEAATGLKYIKGVVADEANSVVGVSSRVEVTGIFSTGSVTGDLNPTVNYGGNLGNATHAWKDLWLSGSTINLGTTTIKSVGNAISITDQSITGQLTVANVAANGYVVLSNTASSTDALTGALVVAGGVGIGGNIHITGNATVSTDLAVTGSTTIGGNIAIAGNLTVSGSTTYVNTTNTSIRDAIIDLGGSDTTPGGNITGDVVGDRGMLLHGGSATNQFMGWNTILNEFQFQRAVTISAGGEVAGTLANLSIDTLNSSNVFGTVKTADQPDITTMLGLVETLTTVATIGNAAVTLANIATANVGTLFASGLAYPIADATAPVANEVKVMSTNGAKALSFSTIHTDRLANASSSIFINLDGSTDVIANGILSFSVIETGATVTGVLAVSDTVSAPIVNAPAINTSIVSIGGSVIRAADFTTTAITPTVIASVDATVCRAVDFFVKGENSAEGGKYTVATITAIHNGTEVDYSVHSKLSTSGGAAGSFSVVKNGNFIELVATPSSSASTIWVTQIRTI